MTLKTTVLRGARELLIHDCGAVRSKLDLHQALCEGAIADSRVASCDVRCGIACIASQNTQSQADTICLTHTSFIAPERSDVDVSWKQDWNLSVSLVRVELERTA